MSQVTQAPCEGADTALLLLFDYQTQLPGIVRAKALAPCGARVITARDVAADWAMS